MVERKNPVITSMIPLAAVMHRRIHIAVFSFENFSIGLKLALADDGGGGTGKVESLINSV